MTATAGMYVQMRSLVTGDLRITIDIPSEHADAALTILGRPVGQTVAVALLNETAGNSCAEHSRRRGGSSAEAPEGASQPPDSTLAERGGKPRTPWHELSRAQQAGIRCGEERFVKFMNCLMPRLYPLTLDDVADGVRSCCGVTSRADLDTDEDAAAKWDELEAAYQRAAGLMAEDRG